VAEGSKEAKALNLDRLQSKRARLRSDEDHILDLCDKVLGVQSCRQHRFNFLRGDSGPRGRPGRQLPVDAYYPTLKLVIEYRERQHSEKVPHFDKRPTVSGMPRGEQRKKYDDLRETVLKQHRINLVTLDYSDFEHDGRKRLRRVTADEAVLREKLARFVPPAEAGSEGMPQKPEENWKSHTVPLASGVADEQRLRADYVNATPRQRLGVIAQRIADPNVGPNLVITLVSAVEAFARALVVEQIASKEGVDKLTAYARVKNVGPAELVGRYLSKLEHPKTPTDFFGKDVWRDFLDAITYRHLLVHECTYLRWAKLVDVNTASQAVLSRLAETAGLADHLRTN
jgi:hypothetical protein